MLPPPEDTPHGPHIDQEEAHAQDMGDEGPVPNDLGVHEEHRRDAGAEAVQQEGRKVDFGEKHPVCPSEPVHPCGGVIVRRRREVHRTSPMLQHPIHGGVSDSPALPIRQPEQHIPMAYLIFFTPTAHIFAPQGR